MNVTLKPYTFKAQDTITGAIRLYNDFQVTQEEIVELMKIYNESNQLKVAKPGTVFMIPVIER